MAGEFAVEIEEGKTSWAERRINSDIYSCICLVV
jgi:hypothetical protein